MTPDTAWIVCRAVHDGAAMLLWGSFAYLAALVPRDLARLVDARLQVVRVAASLLAVATTAAALPLQAARVGSGWGDVIDAGVVHDVLFATSIGRAWIGEAVASVLVAAALAAPERRRSAATALASGLLVATLALGGHAAMDEGWRGWAHRLNDAAHVLAGGAWLGALVPLLPILRALDAPHRCASARTAVHRFSTAGHVAVALVLTTGLLNTAVVLGRWPTDWASPYQAMLAAKIAMVTVLTGLAIINRYAVLPRMRRHRAEALRTLRAATYAEIALGIAVIGLVAVFGTLEPA